MKRHSTVAVALLLSVSLTSGCSTQAQTDYLAGAILGAVAGAAVGYLVGDDADGTAMGAGAGAALGMGTVFLTRVEYDSIPTPSAKALPADGIGAQVDLAAVEPSTELTAKPGERVVVPIQYVVAAPAGVYGVPVSETLRLDGPSRQMVATSSRTEVRAPGAWDIEPGITIPADAAPGLYSLEQRVETANGFDVRSVAVRVEAGTPPPA